MKKDSYYFPHFYNARSDRKMLRVRRELGIEGYAIYFMLLEILREQTDFSYPLSDIDLLADEFRTSEQKISTVISSYDLFQVTEDKFFYSQKLIANLQPYLEKSERARLAARKRWDNSKKIDANAYTNADANALPKQSKCNASQNAKRREESKGEDINTVDEPLDKNGFLIDFTKWTNEDLQNNILLSSENKPEYTKEMKVNFYKYWTAPNPKGKQKFKLEKTWSTSSRLSTWYGNNKKG